MCLVGRVKLPRRFKEEVVQVHILKSTLFKNIRIANYINIFLMNFFL